MATVDRVLTALDEGHPSPKLLEAALRSNYPRASVRRQDALAQFGTEPVWYVFRDGPELTVPAIATD